MSVDLDAGTDPLGKLKNAAEAVKVCVGGWLNDVETTLLEVGRRDLAAEVSVVRASADQLEAMIRAAIREGTPDPPLPCDTRLAAG